MWKRLIIGLFAVAVLSTPAFARVNLNFDVEVVPPPPRVEVVPEPRPGYVWAPGYWVGAGALGGVSGAKRSALAFRARALGTCASASLLITSRPCH